VCVISARPAEVHTETWDPARKTVRLHCAGGPALKFRDGWQVHAWHGRRVPAWVTESPTVEQITGENNTEIRRCAIEALGWPQFITQARLERIGRAAPDPGNPGRHLALYDVPETLWGSPVRLLLMTNGSAERDGTRRQYAETVAASCRTPVEAAAWQIGLTASQYTQTVRRT